PALDDALGPFGRERGEVVDAEVVGDTEGFGGDGPDGAGELAEGVEGEVACVSVASRLRVVSPPVSPLVARVVRGVHRVSRLPNLVDRRDVARRQREVKPGLVTAAHSIRDRLRQPVWLRPDDFGAEDQAEVVDAAEGIAPRDAHE